MKEEKGRETPPASRAGSPTGTPVGDYLGLGLQFALVILLSVFLGQWLDRRFGTEPWLLLVGVFLGAGGAFYSMYRRLMAGLRQSVSRREQERKRQ
jgi:F0F1-type ATP synthase assembly protein I